MEQAGRIPIYVAGELGEAAAIAARTVQISLNIPKGATLVPLSSAYPVTQQGDKAMVSAGDIPCATELEIPLRLALLGQKAGTRLSLDGSLTFQSPAGNRYTLPINGVSVRYHGGKILAAARGRRHAGGGKGLFADEGQLRGGCGTHALHATR